MPESSVSPEHLRGLLELRHRVRRPTILEACTMSRNPYRRRELLDGARPRLSELAPLSGVRVAHLCQLMKKAEGKIAQEKQAQMKAALDAAPVPSVFCFEDDPRACLENGIGGVPSRPATYVPGASHAS